MPRSRSLAWRPALSSARRPQGRLIKVEAFYDRPFWRDAGLTGAVVSDTGPAKICYDVTPADDALGGLLGFVGGAEARQWGDDHAALSKAYAGEHFVRVASLTDAAKVGTLAPESLNGTNMMTLYVFGSDESGQVRLVALLDNLGKGASGAAVQNLNLMLGLPEGSGL